MRQRLPGPADRPSLRALPWTALSVVLWLGTEPVTMAGASCGAYLHRGQTVDTSAAVDGSSHPDAARTTVPAPASPCANGRCQELPAPPPVPQVPVTSPSSADMLTAHPARKIRANRPPTVIESGADHLTAAGYRDRIDRPPRG